MSTYPEHDKLRAIADKSQVCGEFIDWLHESGIQFAVYHAHSDACDLHTNDCPGAAYSDGTNPPECRREFHCGLREDVLCPCFTSTTRLLAEFFEIDEAKLEREKRAMLDKLRAAER